MSSALVRLIKNLRRRRVFRATGLYIVGAWVLIQVLGAIFQAFGIPETAMRFVFFAVFLAYPIAVYLTWRYELTEQGLKRSSPGLDEAESQMLALGRSDYLVITALVTIVVIIALGTFSKVAELPYTLSGEAPANSVAVLPFKNMSDDASNEYFSDGITEELLDRLASIPELRVAARTSSFYFKNKDLPVEDVASQLDVRSVVEGSVRKAGDKVRIAAQLVNAEDGYQLWSKTYDRKLADIFAVQDEIANSISGELAAKLGVTGIEKISQKPTDSLAAYDFYLLGQHDLQLRGESAIRASIVSFAKALELDPNYARAYSSIAKAFALLPEYSKAPMDESFAAAAEYAQHAIELDPSLGAPHAILGYMSMRVWNWSQANRQFEDAIRLDAANATTHQWYANFLNDVFFSTDALAHAEQAQRLDRASPAVNIVLAMNYLIAGDDYNMRAIEASTAARDYGYRGLLGEQIIFAVRLRQGEAQLASDALANAYLRMGRSDSWVPAIADAYANVEKRPDAIAQLKKARDGGSLGDGELFYFFALLGDADAFIELARQHLSDKRLPYVWVLLPEAGPVRTDARFSELLFDIGLPQFWDQSHWPPFCIRNGDLPACGEKQQ